MTLLILTVAIGYSVTKTYDLIRRANPNIITNVIASYFDRDFAVNLYD